MTSRSKILDPTPENIELMRIQSEKYEDILDEYLSDNEGRKEPKAITEARKACKRMALTEDYTRTYVDEKALEVFYEAFLRYTGKSKNGEPVEFVTYLHVKHRGRIVDFQKVMKTNNREEGDIYGKSLDAPCGSEDDNRTVGDTIADPKTFHDSPLEDGDSPLNKFLD